MPTRKTRSKFNDSESEIHSSLLTTTRADNDRQVTDIDDVTHTKANKGKCFYFFKYMNTTSKCYSELYRVHS